MVLTRPSRGARVKAVSYKEIEEDEDFSDGEIELLKEERSKGILKGNFGSWTVRFNLSQNWGRDTDPLPMLERVRHANYGKKSLDVDELLESYKKPRVRMNVRLGKLSGFMKMPFDIVMEIGAYLEPLDLLHLGRTNAQLRSLFLSKRAHSIWRAVHKSLDMPNCPEDLNEPSFASLLFEKECHVCGASNIDKMSYETRIKLCRSCRPKNFAKAKTILEEMEIDPIEYDAHIANIGNLLPHFEGRHMAFGEQVLKSTICSSIFLRSDFVEMVGRYFLLLRHGLEIRAEAFAEKRRQVTERLYEHSGQTRRWLLNFGISKRKQKDQLADQRHARVLNKLRELGHPEDDFPKKGECKFYAWEALLQIPHELKPRAWKQLYPKLKALISENKTGEMHRNILRKRKQRRNALGALYSNFLEEDGMDELAGNLLMPTIVDLIQLPEFNALIANDDEEVDFLGWTTLLPTLRHTCLKHGAYIVGAAAFALIDGIKRIKGNNLINPADAKTLLPNLPDLDSDSDTSNFMLDGEPFITRAFAFFRMKKLYVGYAIPFANVVAGVRNSYRERDEWLEEWNGVAPWKGEYMEFSDISMLIAIALLKDMGKDWKTVEMDELNGMGTTLGCARCPKVEKRMSWMELVMHYVDQYDDYEFWKTQLERHSVEKLRGKPPYWTLVINTHDVDDSSKRLVHLPNTFTVGTVNALGRELDVREREERLPADFPTFDKAACEICWRLGGNVYRRFTPVQLKQHIRSNHGKEPETRDVHLTRQ
ncbi:hypothetical protein SCHPADRAFT_876526 [Schizopora paradoxa]|uniref:F-box domain-containing protein n=1 Tax=Schizopora paradoxa TaxID=27342 RepID=A0A0H2RJ44_9AGAM|nr:hypothetical protein SCHPADRAFT_876526 [Schizopora paradoxa]